VQAGELPSLGDYSWVTSQLLPVTTSSITALIEAQILEFLKKSRDNERAQILKELITFLSISTPSKSLSITTLQASKLLP